MSLVKHLVLPGYEVARVPLSGDETITDFLDRAEWNFKLPTICVMNGEPVLRKNWATTTMSDRDSIYFYSKPYGGGGGGGSKTKTILGIVALVALAAFAPYLAGTVLGLAAGTFAYTAAVAAITIGGGLLVSTFLSPAAASNDSEQIAQVYSLSASGNTASPFQVIPVQYGRLKSVPQYASLPWTEFIGNDAFLNVLLAIGQGRYDLETILIDDTILWDRSVGVIPAFNGVELLFCQPGEPFTLFPSNVVSSSEVSGQTITGTPLGYFIVNNAGTEINAFAVDIIFPAGMRFTDDKGRHNPQGLTLFIKVRQVDDLGSPIGPEILLNSIPIILNTPQPQRMTFRYPLNEIGLSAGRYEVMIWRTTPQGPLAPDNVVDEVDWVGLRGYLVGSQTYPSCAVLGIRIRATAQLSQNSAKNFGVITTRRLNVWNGSTMVEQATQSAWWAAYDAATSLQYGLQWPVNKIDFQTFVDQAAAADARGDTFNYRFESAVTFQAALDLILQSNRAKTTWLGDVLSGTRDEWQEIPQMLLSDQQIVRGSLSVDYVLNNDSSSDCVQLQFLNEDTWQPGMLQYPPNGGGFVAQAPAAIQIDGITRPEQVFNELRFFWNQSQKRRIQITCDTEHDGRLLRFGSAIKLQSFLPQKWGASGEVVSYNTSTKIVTINRSDLNVSEAGQHYIEFRSRTGGYFGPVKCSFSTLPTLIQLSATDLSAVEADLGMTIDQALTRMDGAEPPSFVWGLEGNLSRHCIVLSGKPNGDKVTLQLTVDSIDVHDTTGATQPPLPSPPPYADPRSPVISGLVASFKQNVSEPQLSATWWPSKGAIYYKAQISYDGGVSWTTVADSLQDPMLTCIVAYSDLRLRVAGVGYLQGAWSQVDVTAPTLTGPTNISADDLEAGLHDYVTKQLKDTTDLLVKVTQQIASIAAETDSSQTTNAQQLRVVASNAFAAVSSLATVVANDQASFAAYQVTVEASFAGLDASVTTNSSAIATLNGTVNAMWSVHLDVNGYISGITAINTGSTSEFVVLADHFAVAEPGVSGGTPISVFSIGTVGGTASVGMSGNMFLDGTLTARMINVISLSALSANLGSITAGTMVSPTGKMVVDLNNEHIIFSD